MWGRDFDLVIFDNDGVLVDTERVYARVSTEVYPQFGFPMSTEEYYRHWMAIKTAVKLRMIEDMHGVHIDLDAFEAVYRPRLAAAFETGTEAVDGAREALAGFPWPLCVASSAPRETTLRKHVLTGLDALVQEEWVFSGKDVQHGKPAPDLFLHAAAQFGAAPERCLVVEDSAAGIQAARAAGMTAIGFMGASHAPHVPDYARTLEAAGAQALATHLLQIEHVARTLTRPHARTP